MCAASCTGGIFVSCERQQDCVAPTPYCCGTSWGFTDAGLGNATCVSSKSQCNDPQSLVLCSPDAGAAACTGGDTCSGTKTIGGQTFYYCN